MAAPEGVDDADSTLAALAARVRGALAEGGLILVYIAVSIAVGFASVFVSGYALTKVIEVYGLDWSSPQGALFTMLSLGVLLLVYLHVRQFMDWFAEVYLGIETTEPRRQSPE